MYKTIITSMLAISLVSIAYAQSEEIKNSSKMSLDITAGLSFSTTHLNIGNTPIRKLPTFNNVSFGLYLQKKITNRWSYGYNLYGASYQIKLGYDTINNQFIPGYGIISKHYVGTSIFFAPQILLNLNNPSSKFNIQTGLMTGVGFMFMKGLLDPKTEVSLPILGTIGLPVRASYQIGGKISLVANITPQYVFTIYDLQQKRIIRLIMDKYKTFSIPYRIGVSFNL